MAQRDELLDRLHRCYAAIDAAVEGNLNKFPPRILADDRQFSLYQDFLGGLTEAEISNLAHSIIHNIANLRDHLRGFARKNGLDAKMVNDAVAASIPLQLMIDLSNNDKHGYPPRDGGESKQAPRLLEIKRVLRMSTGSGAGSGIAIVLTPSGPRQIASGGGFATVVITGTVVDRNGAQLGFLYDLGNEALKAWEQQLTAFGVLT